MAGFLCTPALPTLEVPLPEGALVPDEFEEDDVTVHASSMSSKCRDFLLDNAFPLGTLTLPKDYPEVDTSVNKFDDLNLSPLYVKNVENSSRYDVRVSFVDANGKALKFSGRPDRVIDRQKSRQTYVHAKAIVEIQSGGKSYKSAEAQILGYLFAAVNSQGLQVLYGILEQAFF
jgi:hypothetical protein